MRTTSWALGLTAAVALAMSGPAFAQKGGKGGGHGGGHGGGGHPVAVSPAGAYHTATGHPVPHYGYYGAYPYYHNGNSGKYWPYAAGGFALGLALGSSYGTPSYSYGGAAYPYYYSAPAYEVAPTVVDAAPAASPQPATLNVIVPKEDAQVFLGDSATTSSGAERQFQSPSLEPGKNYQYTVRAKWVENGKQVEQTRNVPVRAGQEVTVDFRKPAREAVGLPESK